MVPATPPVDVRLGAAGTVPLMAEGHAGVVTVGDGLGEVEVSGAGCDESGRSGAAAAGRASVDVDAELALSDDAASRDWVAEGDGALDGSVSVPLGSVTPVGLGAGLGVVASTMVTVVSGAAVAVVELNSDVDARPAPGIPSTAPLATGTASATIAASAVTAVMLL